MLHNFFDYDDASIYVNFSDFRYHKEEKWRQPMVWFLHHKASSSSISRLINIPKAAATPLPWSYIEQAHHPFLFSFPFHVGYSDWPMLFMLPSLICWNCCYGYRTYKRYYYFQDTTGESSWEYPEDGDNEVSSTTPGVHTTSPGGPHSGLSSLQVGKFYFSIVFSNSKLSIFKTSIALGPSSAMS